MTPFRNGRRRGWPAALVSVIVAGALMMTGCSDDDKPQAPPSGVTITGLDDNKLEARVGAVITMIRQRDTDALAHQDIDDRGHRGGPDAEKGAGWLVRYFADPLQGPLQAEISSEQNGPLIEVCLSFGKPQRQLELDFNDYDKNGVNINGGSGLWPFSVRQFAEVADKPPKMRTGRGLFCKAGRV
ncbi:hypothetical protein J4573_16550 [Actinomadura barringtoniae]|uniref:Lipoprotein n=1 Tax=Actinomadura barringtoniae TaxID=1427535 RepID=A0A939PGD9_9ACTN|nr:hypothetical protein [Actinomadura barringtoniae]MBO2448714.1 hypothetical protein [Actinomadura barringtoniae]